MCATVFKKVQHRLGRWRKSDKRLRMGNGTVIPSLAVWNGRMRLGEATVKGEFLRSSTAEAAGLSSWGNLC
jgi:hypothetical protein